MNVVGGVENIIEFKMDIDLFLDSKSKISFVKDYFEFWSFESCFAFHKLNSGDYIYYLLNHIKWKHFKWSYGKSFLFVSRYMIYLNYLKTQKITPYCSVT